MHIDKRCAVLGRHAKFVPEQLDGLFTEDGIWSGEIGEIGGMHGERAEAVLLHARAEGGELLREFGAPRPPGGVARKDLQPGRSHCCSPVGRLDEAATHREVRTKHAVEPPRRCGWRAALLGGSLWHGAILPRRATPCSRPSLPRTNCGEWLAGNGDRANSRTSSRAQGLRRCTKRCAARPDVVDEDDGRRELHSST